MTKPGPWSMRLHGFSEVLPSASNYVELNHDKLDVHGLPTLNIHAKHGENDVKLRQDSIEQAEEMLAAAGGKDVTRFEGVSYPGFGIHEMGTARTMNEYLNTPMGATYGFSQNAPFIQSKPPTTRTSVPGLFLASAFGSHGGGFVGAMLSGANAAKQAKKWEARHLSDHDTGLVSKMEENPATS